MPATFNAEHLLKRILWMQGNFHVQLSIFILTNPPSNHTLS